VCRGTSGALEGGRGGLRGVGRNSEAIRRPMVQGGDHLRGRKRYVSHLNVLRERGKIPWRKRREGETMKKRRVRVGGKWK